MKLYLDSQGYPSDGFRLTYDRLAGLNAPSIAMIDTGRYRHFVVVKGVTNDRILVGDPMLGLRTYRRAEFEKMWNGIAFLIRGQQTGARYNDLREWLPYAPTPWSAAVATVQLDVSRDVPTPYQIAPVLNLDSILQ
jgi:predicted double-glycine peptidase